MRNNKVEIFRATPCSEDRVTGVQARDEMFRLRTNCPSEWDLPFLEHPEFRLSTKIDSLLYYFRIRIASECELDPELVPVDELVIRKQILLNCPFAESFRVVTSRSRAHKFDLINNFASTKLT